MSLFSFATLRDFHTGDAVCLFIIACIYKIFSSNREDNEMVVPILPSSTSLNTNYAFPIKLNEVYCSPYNMTDCTNINKSPTQCCQLAMDSAVFPYEHVTEMGLVLFCLFIPVGVIFIRSFMWSKLLQYPNHHTSSSEETNNSNENHEYDAEMLLSSSSSSTYSSHENNVLSQSLTASASVTNPQQQQQQQQQTPRKFDASSTFSLYFWFLFTWECMFGLLLSILLQAIVTDFFKAMVGAPRPIYYSLLYWSQIIPIDGDYNSSDMRMHYLATATRSFPSGHSSTVLAGLGYIAMILFVDAERLANYNTTNNSNNSSNNIHFSHSVLISRCYFITSFVLLFLGLWVGATRIIDYWHFYWDVLAGFEIGIFTAYVSYRFVMAYTVTKLFNKHQLHNHSKDECSSSNIDNGNYLYLNNNVNNTNNNSMHAAVAKYNRLIKPPLNTNNNNTNPRHSQQGSSGVDDFESGFVWTPERHGMMTTETNGNHATDDGNHTNSGGGGNVNGNNKNDYNNHYGNMMFLNQGLTPRKRIIGLDNNNSNNNNAFNDNNNSSSATGNSGGTSRYFEFKNSTDNTNHGEGKFKV